MPISIRTNIDLGAKFIFPLLLLTFLFTSCTSSHTFISNDLLTIPYFPIEPAPQGILVLNSLDIPALNYRKNKEELFISLVDSLMNEISRDIQFRGNITSDVLPGLTHLGENEASINGLMKIHQASHAIVITGFDVHFEQTHVEVTGDKASGKDREAFYDIVSLIHYTLFDQGGIVKAMPIYQSRFHSSRSVISGLLAAGPNVVPNMTDAISIVQVNGFEYLNQFLPMMIRRTRKLFDTKEFSKIGDAISKQDYEAAFQESLRFINDPDKKIAARANYNCAMLKEKMNQPEAAKRYLQDSLALFALEEAYSIKHDYGIF
jgi:hypothetical protein